MSGSALIADGCGCGSHLPDGDGRCELPFPMDAITKTQEEPVNPRVKHMEGSASFVEGKAGLRNHQYPQRAYTTAHA
jgi:hypothetical protein